MSRFTPALLSTLLFIVVATTVYGECPNYSGLMWGCAYMPKCFGDSMCPTGQKCCSHPCGNQCAVPCKTVDCSAKTCEHGFQRVNGCPTCICNDGVKCTTVSLGSWIRIIQCSVNIN